MTLLHPEQDEANSGFSVLQFGQIAISSGTGVDTPENWVNYVVCEPRLQVVRRNHDGMTSQSLSRIQVASGLSDR
jgi:hypothetical protein